MEQVTIRHVQHCSRCGEDHSDMLAKPLARPFAPPEAGGIVWTHWYPCPTNGDPVLVIVSGQAEIDALPPGTPEAGRMTPRGRCSCAPEASDPRCEVHPRCDSCGENLENLVAFTLGESSRYCRGCYSKLAARPCTATSSRRTARSR